MSPVGHRPAISCVHYTKSCNTQSSAREDGQNNCPKHVQLTGIINNPLLLHLVGCQYYLYFTILFWDLQKNLNLTLILNTWRIQWAPNNACKWQMGFNTLRTGDADLRFYITTVQDGWRKSAFLTSACFPCTIDLIMQYIEAVSEWFCWRMFTETCPHSELTFRRRVSCI